MPWFTSVFILVNPFSWMEVLRGSSAGCVEVPIYLLRRECQVSSYSKPIVTIDCLRSCSMEIPVYSPAHTYFPTSSLNRTVNEKPTLLRNSLCPNHFQQRQHASHPPNLDFTSTYSRLQNSTTLLALSPSSWISSMFETTCA